MAPAVFLSIECLHITFEFVGLANATCIFK